LNAYGILLPSEEILSYPHFLFVSDKVSWTLSR
jgi:hypothetical protein